jgi:uncharacterized membrane protein
LSKLFEILFGQSPDTFAKGKLVFTSPLPGEVRLLLAVAAIALVWWLYRKAAPSNKRTAHWLLGLRIATIGLLLLILGAPVMRQQTPNKDKLFTAVLVDTSQSMSIPDVAGKPRLDAARGLVTGQLLPTLGENSQVVLYSFADLARRASTKDLEKATGARTDLFGSIRSVDGDLRNVPLGAVVMLSDGARNTGGSATDAARLLQARGVPLYVVGVGDPNPPKDLEVVQVLAPAKVPAGSQVDLDVTVRHSGYTEPFELILKRSTDLVVTKKITPEPGTDLQRLRLNFTPDVPGVSAYRLEIPPAQGEAITQNNGKDFLIESKDERLPVLYVEGSPRMEYRFLRRALFRDPTFRVVSYILLQTGRSPYLQGANESERESLAKGFPDSMEQLANFKAIILGDIEAGFFKPEQQQLIEEFVKNRGGGLLMLGGVNSFGPGGYATSPVGRALPVVVSPRDASYSDQQFTAQVAPGALDHPVMRLNLDPVENKLLWDNAPPLIGVTPTTAIKPGATLLLQKPDTRNPILAVQNYGQGRSAAFTSGGSWYWQVSRPSSDEFHEKFWKQLVRWLAVGAEDQLTVRTDASVYSRGDAVTITASVIGKDLRPLDDAHVTATITDALGNAQQLPMDWILSEEGVYAARLTPEVLGQYSVSVNVEGWSSAPASAAFVISDATAEFADAAMKRDVLKDMATTTGGKYFELADAGGVAKAVADRLTHVTLAANTPQDKPIWDMPILLVLVIVLISAEWLIRRRSGLS